MPGGTVRPFLVRCTGWGGGGRGGGGGGAGREGERRAAGPAPPVAPGRLQPYTDGLPVPMLVEGQDEGRFAPGDGIEFYGEGLDTPSTAVRVYWLGGGAGAGLR